MKFPPPAVTMIPHASGPGVHAGGIATWTPVSAGWFVVWTPQLMIAPTSEHVLTN